MSKYIIVSQLDVDGVFVGVTRASESPLEPDVYLYPRGTVAAAPPDIPDGFFAKWAGKWVVEPAPVVVPPPPEPEPKPVLTPAQFWMQLAIDGDEAAALAVIDTLPRPLQIYAHKARQYEIDDPLLLQLAAALGKNDEQIDAFFRKAAKL